MNIIIILISLIRSVIEVIEMAGQLFIINMKQILYKINFTAENDYSFSN
jgi:hypothetical protein